MRDLYSGMEPNGPAIAPLALLTQLRVLAPQFAEVDERSGGFAQQGSLSRLVTGLTCRCRRSVDADRICIAFSVTNLGRTVLVHRRLYVARDHQNVRHRLSKLICRSRCVEAPEEPVSIAQESALKLECNISISTNFLLAGVLEVGVLRKYKLISQSLDQHLEKNSPSLGRMANYEQQVPTT